jgi:hypothetical protein
MNGDKRSLRSIRPTRARRPSDASVDPTDARLRNDCAHLPGRPQGTRPSEGLVRFRHTPRAGGQTRHDQQGCKDSNPVHEFWRLAALPGAHPCLRTERGYSAGVEPGASRFTVSRAAVTPRTPSVWHGHPADDSPGLEGRTTRSHGLEGRATAKRKGRESNPQGSSLARVPGGSRRRSGGPSESRLPIDARRMVPGGLEPPIFPTSKGRPGR